MGSSNASRSPEEISAALQAAAADAQARLNVTYGAYLSQQTRDSNDPRGGYVDGTESPAPPYSLVAPLQRPGGRPPQASQSQPGGSYVGSTPPLASPLASGRSSIRSFQSPASGYQDTYGGPGIPNFPNQDGSSAQYRRGQTFSQGHVGEDSDDEAPMRRGRS